ncbi:MAG: hypothetical protein JSU82_16605 [Rhodospirillales bacterium]|nr:MAG: hypothetical protein JSU82_16605 [Rhodospirillales bacterium]
MARIMLVCLWIPCGCNADSVVMSLRHTKGLQQTYARRLARPAVLEVVSDLDARADLTAASDIRNGLRNVFEMHLARMGDSCPPVVGHNDIHWISVDRDTVRADLASLFARVTLDIVHTHRFDDLTTVASTARQSGIPYLVHTVGNDANVSDERVRKQILELAAEHNVTLVATSREIASRLSADRDIAVVPSAIDCNRYRPDSPAKARLKTGLPVEPRIIGCAGPESSLEMLFSALTAMEPDVHVALFGAASPGSLARGMLRELNLDERVHILGGWALPESIHQAIDVFYQGAAGDFSRRPILAAQACGKPVVATSPIEPEMLCPESGHLLSNESVPALVEVLKKALSISPAPTAREFVENHWNLSSSIGIYESLIRATVGATPNDADVPDGADDSVVKDAG